jgi:deoxycytidylate deaminase
VRGGKILAEGINGLSGGRRLTKSKATTHAEIDALKSIRTMKERKRGKLTLISVAYDGIDFKMSRPCINCCKAIIDQGINWVYYYDRNDGWMEVRASDLLHDTHLSSGDRNSFL